MTHRIVTPAELHHLAEALGANDAPMVDVAAVLGLRWGECAGLRVRDIDFLGGRISVQSRRTRGLKSRMVTDSPKWNSQRFMAAPAALLGRLTEHLRQTGPGAQSSCAGPGRCTAPRSHPQPSSLLCVLTGVPPMGAAGQRL